MSNHPDAHSRNKPVNRIIGIETEYGVLVADESNAPDAWPVRLKNHLFKRERVGAISWGLVRGRTNTHLLWAVKRKPGYDPLNPSEWFHDIFHPDGTPYRQSEVDFIRGVTAQKP